MRLVLLTGDMGAGKTLVLKDIFEKLFKKYKTVLMVHEAGLVGMDATFLAQNNIPVINYTHDKVAKEPSRALNQNIQSAQSMFNPDIICTEVTGTVPTPFVLKLYRENFTDIVVQTVIFVADATNFLTNYRKDTEFYNTQLTWADYVVINKGDLVSSIQIEKIRRIIKLINPYVYVQDTRYGVLSKEMLLEIEEDLTKNRLSRIYQVPKSTVKLSESSNIKAIESSLFCSILAAKGSTDPKVIADFLTCHKGDIIRAKGIFLTGYGLCHMQLVNGRVDYKIFETKKIQSRQNLFSLILPVGAREVSQEEFASFFVL